MIKSFSDLVGDTFIQKGENIEFLITGMVHTFYEKSCIGTCNITTIDKDGNSQSFGFLGLLQWISHYDFAEKFFDIKTVKNKLDRDTYVYDFHKTVPSLESEGRVHSFNNYKIWMDNGDVLYYGKERSYEYLPIKLPSFKEGVIFKAP